MTAETNEAVGRVVADVRLGRWVPPYQLRGVTDLAKREKAVAAVGAARAMFPVLAGPVVDASALREQIPEGTRASDLGCVRSPWDSGWIGMVGTSGIVDLTAFWSDPVEHYGPGTEARWRDFGHDWADVGTIITTAVFVGGRDIAQRRAIKTMGPLTSWSLAVSRDGRAMEYRASEFNRFVDADTVSSNVAGICYAFNFLNCRNIEIGAPRWSRPERHRIERTGVQVSEIMVLPSGKYRRSDVDGRLVGGGQPLTPVRGHIIKSGIDGRKCLFGNPNLVGAFWVPQHVRGSREVGEVEQRFTLVP